MNGKNTKIPCECPMNGKGLCISGKKSLPENAKPLSKIWDCVRLKVCKIKGDRKLCARMAQLGVFPGSELELICPVQSQSCMVKVKGSTMSLDQLSAENILVTPA